MWFFEEGKEKEGAIKFVSRAEVRRYVSSQLNHTMGCKVSSPEDIEFQPRGYCGGRNVNSVLYVDRTGRFRVLGYVTD